MNGIEPLSAQRLPREATGPRAPEVWAMMALVAIEATVLASLIASYFHLRTRADEWPPGGIGPPELLLPSLATAAVLASAVPAWLAERAARGNETTLRVWILLPAGMILLGGYIGITVFEYVGLDYGWRTHAYGSIVWTMTALHLAHAAAVLTFALVVWVLSFGRRIDARRRVAIQVNTVYWYFLAGTSLVVYAVLYLSPRLL